jgi:hypothetical protein
MQTRRRPGVTAEPVALGASLIAGGGGIRASAVEGILVRAMAFIWAVILVGGITYFSVIGLTHH